MHSHKKIGQLEAAETDSLMPKDATAKVEAISTNADIQPGCNAGNYMWLFAAPRKKSDVKQQEQPEKEPSFWCFI